MAIYTRSRECVPRLIQRMTRTSRGMSKSGSYRGQFWGFRTDLIIQSHNAGPIVAVWQIGLDDQIRQINVMIDHVVPFVAFGGSEAGVETQATRPQGQIGQHDFRNALISHRKRLLAE